MNKSRPISFFLALLLGVGTAYVYPASSTLQPRSLQAVTATYYVSPTGSDSNPGTEAQPFLTLTKARDIIRTAGQTGVRVYLRGGTYRLTSTFTLDAQDAGTTNAPNVWSNYPGEVPVITSAVNVPLTLGSSGLQTFDLSTIAGLTSAVPQIYFNGQPLTLARYPKAPTPNFAASDPFLGGFLLIHTTQPGCEGGSATQSQAYFNPAALDTSGWTNITDGQVRVWSGKGFVSSIRNITAVDTGTSVISLARDAWYAMCQGNRFYVQNIDEYLTDPGEWTYHPSTKTLNVLLPKTIDSTDALTVPLYYGSLLKITSSHDIQFTGVSFQEVDGSAVFIDTSDAITIAGATIHGTAGTTRSMFGFGDPIGKEGDGVTVYHSTHAVVKDSLIYDTEGHGIAFVSAADHSEHKGLVITENRAENNHIYHVGRNTSNMVGIWVESYGTTVSHNYIHDVPKSGIMGDFVLDTITNNDIRRTNREACDTGAIYTVAQQTGWLEGRNNEISHNYMEDTGGYCQHITSGVYYNDYNWAVSSWGVYLDENTSYNNVHHNIVTGQGGSCFINNHGWGNVWDNNICYGAKKEHGFFLLGNISTASGSKQTREKTRTITYTDNINYFYQVIDFMDEDGYDKTRWTTQFPDLLSVPSAYDATQMLKGDKITHNIFVTTLQPAMAQIYFRKLNVTTPDQTVVDSNVYYDTGSAYRFKGGFPLTDPAYENVTYTLSQWQGYGEDLTSVTANPLLTDPANGDFTLASNSPALSLGFERITQSDITQQLAGCLNVTSGTGRDMSDVQVKVRPVSSTSDITQSAALTSSNGQLTLTGGSATSLTPSTAYDLWIKPAGYLAKKVSSVKNLGGSCITVSNAFVPGDFDGSNTVTFSDIIIAIRSHNNSADTQAQLAQSVFGAPASLGNIVSAIRALNETPQGE